MGKRFWSLAISAALVAGAFTALPVRAQEAPEVAIPATVQIEDPFEDANYLNDQGNGGTSVSGQEVIPSNGDNVTPADASTVADLGKIWFENDAETISVYVQTQALLGNNAPAYVYDVFASPGEGSVASSTFWCLRFSALVPGVVQGQKTTWQGEPQTKLIDRCNVGSNYWSDSVDGKQEILPGPDGTGFVKMTFPRDFSPLLASGRVITGPYARSANVFGEESAVGFASAPQVDNTKFGVDYTITEGSSGTAEPQSDPTAEPPGKNDPPGKGKKKGCDKGKGKKKGACPGGKPGKPNKPRKPTAPSCPAYVPGEEGAEAETTVVTDEATAEKPIELDFTAPAGTANDLVEDGAIYDGTASLYQNIQVDSAAASTGLYVRYEFPANHDYDLYLNYPDGSTAANSGDFNAAAGHELGGGSPEGGWEAGADYEQVMGIDTADCAGYTARLVSYLTTGGATKLKIWLGDVVVAPVAPGGSRALAEFYGLTGMANPSTSIKASQASGTPAANKGCTKGKGKKKGCKKAPVACSPYTPGEKGADQPTVTVTDAHTADAPLIQEISLAPAVDEGLLEAVGAGETPRAVFNVQVDSTSASTGLYVTFEFDTHRDYDLWAYFPDGSGAASAHGFQPLIDTKGTPADESNTASNHGGESTATSENLVGIVTPDCGGYTIEASNYLGEGGDFEVKLWLGEGVTEPGVPE